MAHVDSNEAGLEQRLSSLQAQIDSLRHPTTDDLQPLEQRLSTLTDYSTGILKQWAATADRHAKAVSQLEAHLRELGDAGARLQQDATQRLQDLERVVQQEWTALRDIHEAPVRQLVEQAASLTEVCIATANSAQHGFDRAEARLATLEADFHRTTSELTREVHALLAEVRQLSAASRQLPGDTVAWPLEGVTRLHNQLREGAAPVTRALPAVADAQPSAPVYAPEPTPVEAARVVLAQEEAPSAGEAIAFEPGHRPASAGWLSRPVVAAIVALVILASGVFAWRLQRDVRAATARAEESQRQSQLAAAAAARAAAEKQDAAARQLDAARDMATRAQTIGDVLAAPDLIRYTLINLSQPALTGQVLWSRSRGFVFSASGLPEPPADTTYQIWLLTRGGTVSAATFVPDKGGRVTITAMPAVPRPVLGAIVTTEPTGGSQAPTGEPLLARLPAAPAQS